MGMAAMHNRMGKKASKDVYTRFGRSNMCMAVTKVDNVHGLSGTSDGCEGRGSAAALTLMRADRLPRLQVAVPTASMIGKVTDGWGRNGESFGFSTRPACVAM